MSYSVFDPSGDVRAWLSSGRGVQVWRNADLSSANVGGLAFTPADKQGAPHWRYGSTPEAVSYDAADFVFYERITVRASYTGTPAGFKAADRRADALYEAARARTDVIEASAGSGGVDYYAPIGRVRVAWNVEHVEYTTSANVGQGEHVRPLHTMYRAAVVEWCAIDRNDCAPCQSCEARPSVIWRGIGAGSDHYCLECDTARQSGGRITIAS